MSDEHVKRTFTIENRWHCTSCGAEQLGRAMKCQKCGSPKEKDEEDEVPEPETTPEVTDPALLHLAHEGPDWACAYCGSRVRDESGKCRSCAAPREEDKGAQPIAQTAEKGKGPYRDWPGNFSPGSPGSPPRRSPSCTEQFPAPRAYKFAGVLRALLVVVVACAGLAGLVAGIWRLTRTHPVRAKVTKLDWTYTATLRERAVRHGSDWQPVRLDAYNTSCHTRYYGDEDCHPYRCNPHPESYSCRCTSYDCRCHTSCTSNRNGFSTCTERCSTCSSCDTCFRTVYSTCYHRCPVYRDWCTYDYDDWPVVATRTTTGASHAVQWPELSARPGGNQRLERRESYEVDFLGKELPQKSWVYNPGSLSEFRYFDLGATWVMDVGPFGGAKPSHEVRPSVGSKSSL